MRALALLLCFCGTVAAQETRLQAVEPPDGAVRGPRPVFQLSAPDLPDEQLQKMQLRLALSSDRFLSESYVFDRREREAGWAAAGQGRLLYHPREPLADGDYEWRVSIWNGVDWIEGSPAYRLRIDSVPPAEVTRLRVVHDETRNVLVLDWLPVTLDMLGNSEFVERYRIYGHDRASPFPPAAVYEIGATPAPQFEIALRPGEDPPLWFFKVTAIDAAGNETDRR